MDINNKGKQTITRSSKSSRPFHQGTSKETEKVPTLVAKALNTGNDGPYSHFVSLPLAFYPGLVDKLVAFENKILGMPQASLHGIEKSILTNPKTFHLTILMLKLWNEDRVKAAADALQTASSKVIEFLGNRPVSIRLKGLDLMRGSREKAQVLHARIEEIVEGRLMNACQIVIDAYVSAGLVTEQDGKRKLKLHATLMNAKFRKRQGASSSHSDHFDARGIFELYGSKEWGEYRIQEAHLSQRFVYDDNGYYHCCARVPFP